MLLDQALQGVEVLPGLLLLGAAETSHAKVAGRRSQRTGWTLRSSPRPSLLDAGS